MAIGRPHDVEFNYERSHPVSLTTTQEILARNRYNIILVLHTCFRMNPLDEVLRLRLPRFIHYRNLIPVESMI